VLPALAFATIPLAVCADDARACSLARLSDGRRQGLAGGGGAATLRNALCPFSPGGSPGSRCWPGRSSPSIFSWPGIGRWVYESIESRDYPIVQGASLFIGVIVVMVNLATDLLYAAVDPRIKYD
jgi:hypothetical protein